MEKLLRSWGLGVALLAVPALAAAQAKPVLTPADYGRWEALAAESQPLSPDGRWLVYRVSRTDGTRELRLADRETAATTVLAFGERPAFSHDSQWLADLVGMSEADEAALRKAKKPVHKRLRLTKLSTGESTIVDAVESFAFNASGSHVAMRRYPADDGQSAGDDARGERGSNGGADAAPTGATLVVRDLAAGTDLSIGSVSEFAWQSAGPLLAAAITADGGVGNGVQVFDSASGRLRVLDSSTSVYSGLAWRRDADDLAVLRSETNASREGPSQTVLAWTRLATDGQRYEYAAAADASFPDTLRIMGRGPTWSSDGKLVFVGVADWPEAIVPADGEDDGKTPGSDDLPAVEVWHPLDAIVMPRQKIRANADRRRSMLAAWHVADGTFVRIAKTLDENVTPIEQGDRALVVDTAPYAMQRSIGRRFADVSVASLTTGARTPIKERIDDAYLEASPGGRYLLYLLDDNYWTVDLATGTHVNITRNIDSAFIDKASDATVDQKPPFGVAGWTTGDASVLLYDELDIWEVRPDGAGATRLTSGADGQVRHRYVRLDPDQQAIDRTRPLYISLFGIRSKKSGFALLRPRGTPPSTASGGPAVERLVWEDQRVDRLAKAEGADVYAYIAQSFTDSPDYFVGGPDLSDARQASATNPFMADYAWGRAELVEYRSQRGQPLQGVLRYPANYEPGRRYPMVVYMYERRSDTLHNFSTPSERDYYSASAFTNNGYFLFEPDIVFRPREPGLSVMECVLPAVQAVVKLGSVDADKVGIIGHSWGGFDSAFLATHTTAFAAAVAGAPITDLVSNYGNHHWSSGIAETDHIETGQQRMQVPLWEDLPAYIRNSAVFAVNTMTTPLLVEVGDSDGTVFWHQGVELYNVARRAGKQVVLIVYNGEDHGLRKKPNQVDYQRRIFQWFDHYLAGRPAPAWMTHGTSYLERERELKRLKTTKPATTDATTAGARGGPDR